MTLLALFSLVTSNSQGGMLSLSCRVVCTGISSQCQDSRGPDPGTGVFSLHRLQKRMPKPGGREVGPQLTPSLTMS